MSTNCLFGFWGLPFPEYPSMGKRGENLPEKAPGGQVFHDRALILLKTFPKRRTRKTGCQKALPEVWRNPTEKIVEKRDGAGAGACPSLFAVFWNAARPENQSRRSSMRATMRVAVVTYSLMLNFFITSTS